MKSSVLLLNADYSPLCLISWQKAVKLICKAKVEIIKTSKKVIHNFEKTMEILIPEVIRLMKYVRNLWKVRVPFNKRHITIRDDNTCQYCGKEIKHGGSIDHVIPKSKGGKSNFDNCVLACVPCNNKKDNRLPSEAKMFLRKQPHTPTVNEFILKAIKSAGLVDVLTELGII
jgi:5-methylcytosine-specific restriction endonuclease McrA